MDETKETSHRRKRRAYVAEITRQIHTAKIRFTSCIRFENLEVKVHATMTRRWKDEIGKDTLLYGVFNERDRKSNQTSRKRIDRSV